MFAQELLVTCNLPSGSAGNRRSANQARSALPQPACIAHNPDCLLNCANPRTCNKNSHGSVPRSHMPIACDLATTGVALKRFYLSLTASSAHDTKLPAHARQSAVWMISAFTTTCSQEQPALRQCTGGRTSRSLTSEVQFVALDDCSTAFCVHAGGEHVRPIRVTQPLCARLGQACCADFVSMGQELG